MKQMLKSSNSADELKKLVNDMQASKALGPDGIILEFYKIFWDTRIYSVGDNRPESHIE